MSMVEEAVITVTAELLLRKLASSELLSFARQEQIHVELKKWESKLRKIYAVLEDAEEKQTTNRLVKNWLVDLRSLAYDVEDILDEFETHVLRSKLLQESKEASSKSKAGRLMMNVATCCTSLNPGSIKFSVKMGSRLKEITARLQEIVAQKNDLDLRENSGGRCKKVRSVERLPTTSLTEANVYGRERDREAIIKLLFKEEGNDDGISVIPIVGIGGIGKTTLAQIVYNDDRVKNHFDLRAWACVSDDFDVVRVTKAIMQSIAPRTTGDFCSDLNSLQVELKEELHRKKFFIVLDDVWNENYEMWTALFRPFKAGSSGSKIIVTTRTDYVSSMVGTLPTYQLKELSYDDCLSVFTHHSLGREDFNEHQDLKEIGKKIVNKCKGLPLAAKTLGGLLRSKANHDDWQHVLNSRIWNLPEETSGVIPALKLSYHYLPAYLKRCFAYCSLLPKDYEFQKEEIILLWMAMGFLQQETDEIQPEDLGEDYFRELQSRSFFQQSCNNTSRYVMHDLINDLAQWVVGEKFFFRMENMSEGDKQNKISKDLHHFSYSCSKYDGIRKFEAFYGVDDLRNLTYNGGLKDGINRFEAFKDFKYLRTFLPLSLSVFVDNYLTRDVLKILPKLRCLRVLSLKRHCITELSHTIGDLKHLRYLDLSYTTLYVLPESISNLYNLQTLNLEGCYFLKRLCSDMGNLINLRYLNTVYTKLEGMPSRIGKLTSLRTLTNFVVGKNIGSELKELKFLKHLQGTLKISKLENVTDVEDAKEAELNGKRSLGVLFLEWTRCRSRKAEIEMQVLDVLQPNQKLEQLIVSGYAGRQFPTWLGNTSAVSNLVLLRLENCRNCVSLPSVGQLCSLKKLVVRKMAGIKRVGLEFYGNGCSNPFPLLEVLCFEKMEEWQLWSSYGFGHREQVVGFPHLQQLSIVACPKLKGTLPQQLSSLKRLVIEGCEQLLVSSIASFPTDCRVAIDGCKQVEWMADHLVGLGSLNPIIFPDISSHMILVNRCMPRLSEVEEVEIVGYKEPTSFWHTGIVSLQDARDFVHSRFSRRDHLVPLLKEKREVLQQQRGSPYSCQYLILKDTVCVAKLPQALRSLGFLTRICIENCPELVSFPEAGLPSLLKSIDIRSCNALDSLPKSWMRSTSLESLSVRLCYSLAYIAKNQLPPNLKQLEILTCKNLKALMREENDNMGSSTSGMLPATLENIHISCCYQLLSLCSCGNLPKALKYLKIVYCSKLESIAESFHNEASLESISIKYCENLKVLPEDLHKLSHIEWISIEKCPSLVSFPERGLVSTNLRKLQLQNCKNLEALPNNMHQLNHLQAITIYGCSSLVCFPEGGLPSTNLTELKIEECEKLEVLPTNFHNLTSLQELWIQNCQGIRSFPEAGFPTNLTSLYIAKLKIFEPMFRWGLHRLTSLRKLTVKGCPDAVSFPPVEMEVMLPTSLTILKIVKFPDVEHLSSIIQSLNLLEELELRSCPKLKSFPEKGLPLSLLKLYIDGCPLLEQKCEQHSGQYWPIIAHIPYIRTYSRP